jgi:hypothetical protein
MAKHTIAKLNLKNNSKVLQGFINKLGVEEIDNPEIELIGVYHDMVTGNVVGTVKFTATNIVQTRDFVFTSTDYNNGVLNKLKAVSDATRDLVLAETEFTGATEVV